ncbi:MAG: methionine--tRNA ligase, partial [Candidatus Omnitrophica bacterium]|nr:methionine--tRNA ligase [Candidatus Omnitrophota bacterium]
FMTGTDEHGTKIEKTARDQNKEPGLYVDEMVPQFRGLWEVLGISSDYFIRTTDKDHKQAVQNVLKKLEADGEIYKATYTGWYCIPCESFWPRMQLVEGKCPDCHRPVQELSEDNYFFRLSKYQQWLIEYIETHPQFVIPEIRRNEILGFLRQPLEDLCITRPRKRLSWGIDYPSSPDHVVYVWFDALLNYVTGVGLTLDQNKFDTFWPADVHVVGKDILRQHAVYWPIMLKACGVAMPETVLAHGWWTIGGAKVSKSRGNIVDPFELVKIYGIDAFRYFLLKEVTVGFDGTYSEDLLRERYMSDLANDLGNLWFRLASMLDKYFNGRIPDGVEPDRTGSLLAKTFHLWEKVHESMLQYDPRDALSQIWEVVTRANQFVEENKPWVLAKDPSRSGDLAKVLVTLAECVAHLAVLLLSFLPHTASQILTRLRLPCDFVIRDAAEFDQRFVRPNTAVDRGEVLFPRLEDR